MRALEPSREEDILTFELYVEDQEFVRKHAAVIQQKLMTALLLVIQELQEDERRRSTPIGKGISGDASIETANAQERLRQDHERNFGTEEQRRQQIQETRDAISRNTMVREK
jgi:hypothetical protein